MDVIKYDLNLDYDEDDVIICHYCDTIAIITITGISDMHLCGSEYCAQQCLYSELGEESLEQYCQGEKIN